MSTTRTNTKWVLKQRPEGAFDPDRDALKEEQLIDLAQVDDDKVVVEVDVLSVDAFLRTMLDAEAYHGSIELGGTLPGIGYGTVVAAGKKSGKKVGARVMGMLGAQTLATCDTTGPAAVMACMTVPFMPTTSCLGLLGLTTGLTAYVGVFSAAKPPGKGDTVVVSAAAGACGSIAAQLAKSTGARVVGIAGGPMKQKFLLETLKLDGAIDYKSNTKTLEEQLDEQCPGTKGPDGFVQGIDFFFDCVGGATLDAVLNRIKPGARVVICGAVSQYSGNLNKGGVMGPSNYLKLAERGASMTGYNVIQYMKYLPIGLATLLWYYVRGYVQIHEHIEHGIDSFPGALQKMFSGKYCGKTLCRIKKDEKSS